MMRAARLEVSTAADMFCFKFSFLSYRTYAHRTSQDAMPSPSFSLLAFTTIVLNADNGVMSDYYTGKQ